MATVRLVHVILSRAISAVLVGGLVALPGAGCGTTWPAPHPVALAVPAPDTSECPYLLAPPPPVDLSEVPVPGAPTPAPVPRPEHPVGGPRMAECGLILPDGVPAPPEGISAASWLLADGGSGEVLAAQDPHGRHRPASTIKLLTALLAVQLLPADQVITATAADADQEGSSAGIGPGGTYTVRQLLTGLLLVSGNDAAHALAQQLGGVAATVEQMNQLAARLGASDTRTATPSGLDGPGMSTSAYDLALVFRQVLGNPLLFELLNTPQADFPGFGDHPGFLMGNDNRLLANYPGAVGGKTGFTDDARHTYIGAAVRDGRPLIVVLLRGEQRPVPMWEQAARLLDYGFTLPRDRAVGVLVTGPPVAGPRTPATTPPGSPTDPSEVASPSGAAAAQVSGAPQETDPSAMAPPGTTPLLTVLWAGLPVLLLALLAVLVLRLRRR